MRRQDTHHIPQPLGKTLQLARRLCKLAWSDEFVYGYGDEVRFDGDGKSGEVVEPDSSPEVAVHGFHQKRYLHMPQLQQISSVIGWSLSDLCQDHDLDRSLSLSLSVHVCSVWLPLVISAVSPLPKPTPDMMLIDRRYAVDCTNGFFSSQKSRERQRNRR